MRADAARFAADLKAHRVAVADADVLIYHLEGLAPYVVLTGELLTHLSGGAFRLVLSVLTAAEVLAGPYRARLPARVAPTRAFLETIPNAEIADVTLAVADRAAWLRGQGFRMPEALVMGTALVHRADVLVTNDPVFRRRVPGAPQVLVLDDYCRPGRGPR
jgi:predicted nucleic acid-binding protein